MKLTESQRKALIILKDTEAYRKGMTATQFATKMWADSSKWNNHPTRNSIKGQGMWLCAGSYLTKLKNLGLTNFYYEDKDSYMKLHYITAKGFGLISP